MVEEMIVVSCSSGKSSFAREAGCGSTGASTVGAIAGGSTRAGTPRGDVKLPAAWFAVGMELTGGFPITGAAGGGAGAAAICVGAGGGAG